MPIYLLKYWKLAVALILIAALGVQSCRLRSAKGAIVLQAVAEAQFEADLAVKRAQGREEGAREVQAAAEALQAARAKVEAARQASLVRRAQSAEARAKQLETLLKDAEWNCLVRPLPEEFLNEYRQ